jgi:hypothetical protein
MTLRRKPLVTEAKAFVDDLESAEQTKDHTEVTQMKRNRKRIVAAIAVVGALAAGGAAFTYQNTLPTNNVAGYNHMSVSGADISAINNTLSTDGSKITQVDMTFSSAVPAGSTVEIGWGATAGTAPASLSSTGCTLAVGGLSATCTGLSQDVTTANDFAVAVYQ